MYKLDDIGGLFASMPPNFQTDDIEAFCYAIDRQMKKAVRLGKKLNVWSDLDNADPNHYDMMALTVDAPYYRSELDNATKLRLIKSAAELHKYSGTVKGVEVLLSSMFSQSSFIPWYEYDGDPYHFKVEADDERTPGMEQRFIELLYKSKALRSQLDSIVTVRVIGHEANLGTALMGYYVGGMIEQEDINDN